eukprot:5592082-Prymnesium_polylepis.1
MAPCDRHLAAWLHMRVCACARVCACVRVRACALHVCARVGWPLLHLCAEFDYLEWHGHVRNDLAILVVLVAARRAPRRAALVRVVCCATCVHPCEAAACAAEGAAVVVALRARRVPRRTPLRSLRSPLAVWSAMRAARGGALTTPRRLAHVIVVVEGWRRRAPARPWRRR